MEPLPIPQSLYDIERRRLEHTIDHDLGSLSLSSLHTTTSGSSQPRYLYEHSISHSFITSSSDLSLEYPRAESIGISAQHIGGVGYGYGHGHGQAHGPTGTPRASARIGSRAVSIGGEQSMFVGASPVSTAGHHASNMTLGAGVFKTKPRANDDKENNPEGDFDPERSLGRLVGELGRVMGKDKMPPRPSSPFSPRSPSPLPSASNNPLNLSYTLSRSDQLLTPPSNDEGTAKPKQPKSNVEGTSEFSSFSRQVGKDIRANRPHDRVHHQHPRSRNPLGESTTQNNSMTCTPGPRKTAGKEKSDRVRALQAEGKRSASAPVRGKIDSADVTGLTALMATPAKGPKFGSLGKNDDVGGGPAMDITQTLATLHARLRALETENSVSRRRVKELEEEVETARQEVDRARLNGEKSLREAVSEKSALEDLVQSLRANLARLTVELEQHKNLVVELRQTASVAASDLDQARAGPTSPHSPSVKSELASLRHQIERLTQEVEKLGSIVEQGLENRKRARGERTMRMEKEEMERLVRQVVEQENEEIRRVREDVEKRNASLNENKKNELPKFKQGLYASANGPGTALQNDMRDTSNVARRFTPPNPEDGYDSPTPVSRPGSRQSLAPPTPERVPGPKSRSKREKSKLSYHDRSGGPESPFPSIIGDDLEKEFFGSPANVGNRQKAQVLSSAGKQSRDNEDLPPQTVLARVIVELEDDFAHYRVIYSELADQYKLLDPASVVSKRHVLAEHLREVIDTLESTADQISDLYDLLTFKDKPISVNDQRARDPKGRKSVGEVIRMVKGTLGNDVWERLQRDLRKQA